MFARVYTPGSRLCLAWNLARPVQSIVRTDGQSFLKAAAPDISAGSMTNDCITEKLELSGSTAAFPSMSSVGNFEGARIKTSSDVFAFLRVNVFES